MNATFDGYKVTFDLWDFLGQLTGEQRTHLIDSLACQNEIIDEVVNQLIDGFTTEGSHGSRGYGGDPEATRGIDGARMRIAKASSEIAAEEIEALARQVKQEKDSCAQAWNKYHALLDERRRYA